MMINNYYIGPCIGPENGFFSIFFPLSINKNMAYEFPLYLEKNEGSLSIILRDKAYFINRIIKQSVLRKEINSILIEAEYDEMIKIALKIRKVIEDDKLSSGLIVQKASSLIRHEIEIEDFPFEISQEQIREIKENYLKQKKILCPEFKEAKVTEVKPRKKNCFLRFISLFFLCFCYKKSHNA